MQYQFATLNVSSIFKDFNDHDKMMQICNGNECDLSLGALAFWPNGNSDLVGLKFGCLYGEIDGYVGFISKFIIKKTHYN